MKRYSEYKDSGVKWIGMVPGHWKTPKLNKLVSKVGSGSTPTGGASVYVSEGVKFIRSQNVYCEGLKLDDVAHITNELNDKMQNTKIHAGDVLLNITGGSIGRCFDVDDTLGDANVNQHVCIIRPSIIVSRYLRLFLQSQAGQSQVWFYQKGDREGLSAESIKAFRLTFPPLHEQRAIVSYLDSKVAKIDKYIAVAEQKMKALDELKQTIIADAVTHGINPDVKMKDSGVFWQPQIPATWSVTLLKHILKKLKRDRPQGAELLVCSNSGKVLKRGDCKTGLVANDESVYQGVAAGDLLIHGMDTWHGAIAVSDFAGMCTPVVHVCDSTQDKAFIAYYLRNMAIGKVFKLISNGVRQNTSDFRSWDKMGTVPICLPPLHEQRTIVSYLDRKVSQIDQLCQKERSQIEKLKEYKQRLISDVVTGQVRVTKD